MARSRQSVKRHRTDSVKRLRNRSKLNRLRTAIRRVRELEDGEERAQAYREAQRLLDRASRTRLIHPGRARRLKSRLASSMSD